jgi:hypothetical protein
MHQKKKISTFLVFESPVQSGFLTLRDMDRDRDRSTITIKGNWTAQDRSFAVFAVFGPVSV